MIHLLLIPNFISNILDQNIISFAHDDDDADGYRTTILKMMVRKMSCDRFMESETKSSCLF